MVDRRGCGLGGYSCRDTELVYYQPTWTSLVSASGAAWIAIVAGGSEPTRWVQIVFRE